MKNHTTIEALLAEVPEGCPEWCFTRTFYDVAIALSLPMLSDYGFGLIHTLRFAKLWLKDGRVLGIDPVDGGIEDFVEVVAVVFASVNNDARWWKSCYPSEMGEGKYAKVVSEINRKINALPFVEKYEPSLNW